ncbi:Hypothetical protein SRAE_2000360800 [Strongyloides ratti]|uniref:Uncharacterized protein n=1 Tax=Strongyloides ratti TaxID=34506 RepID=A0A090LN41_STRRB|nr:Hypothetical protein SRAE_2000360800 [Strongyloides ratti]CEF68955.1 Hypothetical protein SRAE_2000360800 [Strongyloides ratti]
MHISVLFFKIILIGFFFTSVYPLRGALMRNGRSFDNINDVSPGSRSSRLIPFQRSPKILRRMLNSGQYRFPDNFYEGIFRNQEIFEDGF